MSDFDVGSGGRSALIAAVLAAALLLPAGLASQTPAGTRAAEGARELTAEASVRLGLERSARVRAAEAEAAEARARTREARAALLPAVRAQAAFTHLGGDIPDAEFTLPGLDTTFTLLPIERDRYHSEISIEQPVFAGGRLRLRARSAERKAAAAEWLAEQARADVALEVRIAFWTLHGALAGLEATDAALAGMAEHVRDVGRRFEEGAVLRSELLAAQTRRSQVQLERVEADNVVRVARLELNRLLGLPAGTAVRPAAVSEAEAAGVAAGAVPDAGALADRVVSSRPELRALAEQLEALRAQASAARGGRLPELALVSRYIYARPNPYIFTEQGEFRGTWEAGVAVRWSVWEGGAQGARVAQAHERVRAAEARLEDARERAVVDVSRQYLEAQRATEALAVAAEHVAHAEESLRVTRQQWSEGVALSAQVLEAEAAYRQATARRARAQAEHAIARAMLLRALGEVW
jgi:outer membrane protein